MLAQRNFFFPLGKFKLFREFYLERKFFLPQFKLQWCYAPFKVFRDFANILIIYAISVITILPYMS